MLSNEAKGIYFIQGFGLCHFSHLDLIVLVSQNVKTFEKNDKSRNRFPVESDSAPSQKNKIHREMNEINP